MSAFPQKNTFRFFSFEKIFLSYNKYTHACTRKIAKQGNFNILSRLNYIKYLLFTVHLISNVIVFTFAVERT